MDGSACMSKHFCICSCFKIYLFINKNLFCLNEISIFNVMTELSDTLLKYWFLSASSPLSQGHAIMCLYTVQGMETALFLLLSDPT